MTRIIEIIKRGRRGADGLSNIVGVTSIATNTAVSNDDSGKAFRATAALTVTIPTVVADGWSIYVDADGGDVTIETAATINGSGSLVISEGNSALIYSSGTAHYARFFVASEIATVSATGVGFSAITGNAATNVQAAIQNLTTLWNAVTTYGKSLIAAADASAARTVLGLASGATAAAASQAEAEAGTENTKYLTSLRGAQARAETRFTSAVQTITSGAQIQVTHNLASTPKFVSLRLVCTTADGGYAIGDEILVDGNGSNSTNSRISTIRVTDEFVFVRYSNDPSAFGAGNKSTGAAVGLTNSSWSLYVEAMI